jgi:hypothetical protein
MILALAVTKVLDREANEMLQTSLPRELWADLMVEDFIQDYPNALRVPDRMRKAKGIARYRYGALALTEAEIAAAFARA